MAEISIDTSGRDSAQESLRRMQEAARQENQQGNDFLDVRREVGNIMNEIDELNTTTTALSATTTILNERVTKCVDQKNWENLIHYINSYGKTLETTLNFIMCELKGPCALGNDNTTGTSLCVKDFPMLGNGTIIKC